MAVRDDFSPGEVLTSSDLNDTFASKLPYSYGTATPSTTTDGFLWYDENDTPPTPKFWDGAAFQTLTSGTILQVVSTAKTDTFSTSLSSNGFASVTGLTASITPSSATSKVLIQGVLCASVEVDTTFCGMRLTRGGSAIGVADAASTRPLLTSKSTGTQNASAIIAIPFTFLDSPATTSAITYGVDVHNQQSGTQTFYVNRSTGDVDSRTGGRTISTVTVMEVAA